MKALIIGATGATGKDLVQVLLQHPGYSQVVAFVRRPTTVAHPKYSEVVTDFEKLENVADAIRGDVWFSCLGTTLKAAGSQERQWQVDYDIPAKFADIARRNGVSRAVLVSAYGASTSSRVFYSRLKGALDEHVAKLNFQQCIVFRPGFLVRKDTDRWMERITALLLNCLYRLGLVKRFRPLPTAILAQKLARAPWVFSPGHHIVELDAIFNS